MNLKRFCCIFTFFFVAINLFQMAARAEQFFEKPIRVGLFYDNTSLESYRLNSQGGFIIGFKSNGDFSPVLEINDNNLQVSSINPQNYTVLKDNLNKNEALNLINQLNAKNAKAYIFYGGNWAVWSEGKINSNYTGRFIKIDTPSLGIILPVKMERPVYFSSKSRQGLVNLNGRNYRGVIEILPGEGKTISCVNELELEQYLYGVVPMEMPYSWPLEALKAQAVASRTYAMYSLSKWEKKGFDVCATIRDQSYGGYDAEKSLSNKAVDETKNQYISYDGKPIMALYHADSGGVTENGKDVYGIELPYLQSVKDPFEKDSPNSTWSAIFSVKDISEGIARAIESLGEVQSISVAEKTSSGRVKMLLIQGTSGTKLLSASELRNILQLKSTFFDIDSGGDTVLNVLSGYAESKNIFLKGKAVISDKGLNNLTGKNVVVTSFSSEKSVSFTQEQGDIKFMGRGSGHGLGMSQWGAKGMAEQGYNYVEILQHYYKNVEIRWKRSV